MMLETQRLELVPLPARQLRLWAENLSVLEKELSSVYRAEPLEGSFLEIVSGQIEKTERDPEHYPWHSFWLLIRKQDRAVIGSADFKNMPGPGGEVEIGYGLGKPFEHRGYMTEAVSAMLGWALAQEGVTSVIAETGIGNLASQRVLRRCGFTLERSADTLWWRACEAVPGNGTGRISARESSCENMNMETELRKTKDFIEEAEKLKSIVRTAWTGAGRRESTAEHSWRLALLAGVLAEDFPGTDPAKVLMMCLIHDIGEIYDGDVSAALRPDKEAKHETEYRAARSVFALLPEPQAAYLLGLWEEYSRNSTPEARLVKALDKAETILQHNQGKNPPDFDYAFNLEYGKEYFEEDEILKRLRSMLDADTEKKAEGRA